MRGRLKKVRRCCVAVVSIMTMLFLSAMTAAEETVPFVFAFTEKTSYVNVGKTKTLEYTIPEGEKVVRWKVSNKEIARINNNGKVKGLKKGTVKVTAISNTGQKIVCKVKVLPKNKKIPGNNTKKSGSDTSGDTDDSDKTSGSSSGGIVYWTPNGEVYHSTSSCSTLSRSKTIYHGTIEESGKSRPCKVCY